MPSSMWRPWSDSRQRTSVSVSSANQSIRSPGFQMPALLIQPPRLVEVPTSGRDRDDAVGHLGRLAGEVDEEAPEGLLGASRAGVLAAEVGRERRRGHGAASARAGAARRPRAHSSPAAPSSGANGASRVVRVLASLAASSRYCAWLSSAEWLAGWPSVGSDQPLIV